MIHIAFSDRFILDLPEGHRFPMVKYELIKEQLLFEGTITSAHLTDPGLLHEDVILLTHDKHYWEQLKYQSLSPREVRRIGFPMSSRLIKRSRSSAMGTLYAALHAMENGVGFNTAGGTHHAYRDRGEGFCLLNDIAIVANYLLHSGKASRILIIDLDVHQGNGTASIFQEDPRVFTFSMHGQDNYPLRKESSDLDIGLKPGTSDDEYLSLLKHHLPALFNRVKPDFVFYQAGVDILSTDKLGHLGVSKNGSKERDIMVFEHCLYYGVPVAVSMGGGYSKRLADIIEAHCNTFREAFRLYEE